MTIPVSKTVTYGLGLDLKNIAGQTAVSHGGAVDGYRLRRKTHQCTREFAIDRRSAMLPMSVPRAKASPCERFLKTYGSPKTPTRAVVVITDQIGDHPCRDGDAAGR
jgi:hypothetical protein